MVHALEEIRRTLVPDGILIDVRPLADRWPVTLVSGRTIHALGRITDFPRGLEDDAYANHAFTDAARLELFALEWEEDFPFFYYWDTPEEMREHIREKWGDFLELDETVYFAAQKEWAASGPDRRVRVQLKMHLARWRKLNPGPRMIVPDGN